MHTAAVITVSDRSYAGQREDASGPCVAQLLEQAGHPARLPAGNAGFPGGEERGEEDELAPFRQVDIGLPIGGIVAQRAVEK